MFCVYYEFNDQHEVKNKYVQRRTGLCNKRHHLHWLQKKFGQYRPSKT